MYVPEESHDGIVPMNHSNKDSRPLAESEEEGRRSRRTLANLTRARHRAEKHACPRGGRACGQAVCFAWPLLIRDKNRMR